MKCFRKRWMMGCFWGVDGGDYIKPQKAIYTWYVRGVGWLYLLSTTFYKKHIHWQSETWRTNRGKWQVWVVKCGLGLRFPANHWTLENLRDPSNFSPPRNTASLRDYQRVMLVNNPLVRAYFLGGSGHWAGLPLELPWWKMLFSKNLGSYPRSTLPQNMRWSTKGQN